MGWVRVFLVGYLWVMVAGFMGFEFVQAHHSRGLDSRPDSGFYLSLAASSQDCAVVQEIVISGQSLPPGVQAARTWGGDRRREEAQIQDRSLGLQVSRYIEMIVSTATGSSPSPADSDDVSWRLASHCPDVRARISFKP